jgi:tetratricopeptide (TPR) repeat protein
MVVAGIALTSVPGRVVAASGEDTEIGGAETERAAAARAAARARALDREGDDDGAGYGGYGAGLGGMLSRRSGLFGTLAIAVAFYFLFMRGRGGDGNASWGSYYLFWIVAPAILAAFSSHPEILIVVVIGFLARRWLPDPFFALRHRARMRSLEVDVTSNPGNVTARRDLARLWLEKRRPGRALPLVEEALVRDPKSLELVFLRGAAQLLLGRHEAALESMLTVVHQEPGFRYGEAYLRAADALVALRRWDDAEDALDHYAKINRSSIEGLAKRVRVRKSRGDAPGATQAKRELREVWRTLPSYQRRNQLGWYLRSLVA